VANSPSHLFLWKSQGQTLMAALLLSHLTPRQSLVNCLWPKPMLYFLGFLLLFLLVLGFELRHSTT
jgi:hypothetical protein